MTFKDVKDEMNEREAYKCPTCGGSIFLQTVTEEHDRVYDSEEHVIERISGMSVGGEWTCIECKTPILLNLLHDIFRGVKFKGFLLLDISEKIKELEEIRKTRIGD